LPRKTAFGSALGHMLNRPRGGRGCVQANQPGPVLCRVCYTSALRALIKPLRHLTLILRYAQLRLLRPTHSRCLLSFLAFSIIPYLLAMCPTSFTASIHAPLLSGHSLHITPLTCNLAAVAIIAASLSHLQTCHSQELVTTLIPICFRSRGLVRSMIPSRPGSIKIIIRYFFLHGRFRLKVSPKHTESVFTP